MPDVQKASRGDGDRGGGGGVEEGAGKTSKLAGHSTIVENVQIPACVQNMS